MLDDGKFPFVRDLADKLSECVDMLYRVGSLISNHVATAAQKRVEGESGFWIEISYLPPIAPPSWTRLILLVTASRLHCDHEPSVKTDTFIGIPTWIDEYNFNFHLGFSSSGDIQTLRQTLREP